MAHREKIVNRCNVLLQLNVLIEYKNIINNINNNQTLRLIDINRL